MTTQNAKLLTFALSFCTFIFTFCMDLFGIWNLATGIATPRQVGAGNDTEGYYPMLQAYKVSLIYLN
jgi:hypothetical protein